ncbi:ABC transporter ATP-binding protein [Microcella daejeonensis]|uniref:ABC transporter ATP-binding protein n=1 Tax=Microcella daejeonensis TaxID=2994971 RepID=UPI0022701F42|nr:ABC transporter ATP-binding protein [Microcella daejeonensis]WAB84723.1 ABC transporter ATP-binding protein [Microcella daejeonensis]
MSPILELLPVIATRRRVFIETVLWSVTSTSAALGTALGTAALIGASLAGTPVDLAFAGPTLLTMGLLASLAGWRESFVSHDLAYGLLGELRGRVFRALRRALPARRDPRRTGDLVTAVLGDVETLEWLYAHTVAQMVSAALVLVITGTITAVVFPSVLAVVIPLVLICATAPLVSRRASRVGSETQAADAAEIRSDLIDTIRGMRELRNARALPAQARRIAATTRHQSRSRMREAWRVGAERGLTDAAFGAAAVGVILVVLGDDRSIDPATIPLALTAALVSLGPASQITELVRSTGTLRASARRVAEAMSCPPATQEPEFDRPRASSEEAGLVVETLSFTYDGGEPVLREVDLRVAPGEIVALVGPSGAGKSTLARLALRYWDPDAGSIRLDGVELRDYPDVELRRLVSAVPQSSPVLRGSIRSNICLGNPEAPDADIHRAAAEAGIDRPDVGLADGLETPVGPHGAGLSGGQRARVAIARAVLRRPRLLILDEATASLDPAADAAVLDLLSDPGDRAVLLIAHRPDTIARADRVVRLTAEGTTTR